MINHLFMKKILLSILFAVSCYILPAQTVYQHVSNNGIYEFLDELASMQIISLNSAIKPYSRIFIAEQLTIASEQEEFLSARQKNELAFYLRDYNKEIKRSRFSPSRLDLFYYSDSIFLLSASPILGVNFYSNSNGTAYHRWNGGDAYAYVGSHFGFYANLRDNFESEKLSEKQYLTRMTGGSFKSGNEYSEMRGGITFSNNWLTIAMVKDHFTWGNNYNGANIFSERAPSVGQVKIKIKPVDWFEFNYVHAWLASGVIDSLRTYTITNGKRIVYHPKYLVANMFTITPFKNLNVSLGNSTIYSDLGFNPSYIIPVFFYKSLDHTYSTSNYGGQNAQMFFDISSRQIKNFHFYLTGFIDEISIRDMFNRERHSNYFSAKAGMHVSNFPIPDISFTIEYTRTNPAVFQHIIETTTFESAGYNFGHYLRDNSQELYIDLAWRPIRTMKLEVFYLNAKKGDEYGLNVTARRGLPFMETVRWENTCMGFRGKYQLVNDGYLFTRIIYAHSRGDVQQFSPELFHGKTTTISAGINWGF